MLHYAVGAVDDVACVLPEAGDVTAGEPLSAANVSQKLRDEFVISVADLVNLLSVVGLNVECRQLQVCKEVSRTVL